MARTIYEKSLRLLLKDMLDDMQLQPGQVFTKSRALEEPLNKSLRDR